MTGTGAAVAILAKAPVPGRVKTRLSPPLDPVEAARVARALLETTIEALAAPPGARRVLFLEGAADEELRLLAGSHGFSLRPQAEGNLGERLGAAFRDLRADGATRVVAIGGDSPTLPPRILHEALDALTMKDLALGPTEDGGYYLVGTASAVENAIFQGIPWSTRSVLSATLERASAAGLSVRMLPQWYDVDAMDDLRRLRGEIDGIEGFPRLRALLDSLKDRI